MCKELSDPGRPLTRNAALHCVRNPPESCLVGNPRADAGQNISQLAWKHFWKFNKELDNCSKHAWFPHLHRNPALDKQQANRWINGGFK